MPTLFNVALDDGDVVGDNGVFIFGSMTDTQLKKLQRLEKTVTGSPKNEAEFKLTEVYYEDNYLLERN